MRLPPGRGRECCDEHARRDSEQSEASATDEFAQEKGRERERMPGRKRRRRHETYARESDVLQAAPEIATSKQENVFRVVEWNAILQKSPSPAARHLCPEATEPDQRHLVRETEHEGTARLQQAGEHLPELRQIRLVIEDVAEHDDLVALPMQVQRRDIAGERRKAEAGGC